MRSRFVVLVAILNAAVAQAQTGSYQVVNVTDGGSITGKVTYEGPVPTPEKLVVDTDIETCAKKDKLSEALLVGESHGLRNAVVYLENIRRGKSWPPKGFTLAQHDCLFEPHVLLLPERADLHLENTDRIAHNVRSHLGESVWQPRYVEKLVVPDFTKRVSEQKVISVTCDVHKWMRAYIVVQKHPYYAVTDENGSFQIAGVPPGQYDLQVWHESLGETSQKVTVKPSAETAVTVKVEKR